MTTIEYLTAQRPNKRNSRSIATATNKGWNEIERELTSLLLQRSVKRAGVGCKSMQFYTV